MELKRQVVAEYTAGATLHCLSKRDDVCRNLIRVWIAILGRPGTAMAFCKL